MNGADDQSPPAVVPSASIQNINYAIMGEAEAMELLTRALSALAHTTHNRCEDGGGPPQSAGGGNYGTLECAYSAATRVREQGPRCSRPMACLILAFLFMTDSNLFEPLMPCDVYLWDTLWGDIAKSEAPDNRWTITVLEDIINNDNNIGNNHMRRSNEEYVVESNRVVVNFATFLLGVMLGYSGFPFTDEIKGKELIRMSADSGDPRAQTWYWQHYDEVDRYLREAAEQCYPPALRELGIAYLDGTDCMAPNVREGLRLLRTSAEMGDVNAQNRLTSFLIDRYYDVGQTKENAHEEKLAGMYYYGVGDLFGIAPESVPEAERLLKLSAAQGNAAAQVKLGRMYSSMAFLKPDDKLAAEYFSMAANAGDEEAQFRLATCYLSGCGVEQDALRAVGILEKLIQRGSAEAYDTLALVYTHGESYGIPSDPVKAAHLCKLGHKCGNLNATEQLARCYRNGTGVERSDRKALKLFHKAAYSGHHVHSDIGWIYRVSFCDEREASRWFRLDAYAHFESTTPDLLESIDPSLATHYRTESPDPLPWPPDSEGGLP
ncbi:sel1 repeat family protein [Pelomyxa schiedti]|nr:sel1 repeat family protein [Pelomyxa schiedti]